MIRSHTHSRTQPRQLSSKFASRLLRYRHCRRQAHPRLRQTPECSGRRNIHRHRCHLSHCVSCCDSTPRHRGRSLDFRPVCLHSRLSIWVCLRSSTRFPSSVCSFQDCPSAFVLLRLSFRAFILWRPHLAATDKNIDSALYTAMSIARKNGHAEVVALLE